MLRSKKTTAGFQKQQELLSATSSADQSKNSKKKKPSSRLVRVGALVLFAASIAAFVVVVLRVSGVSTKSSPTPIPPLLRRRDTDLALVSENSIAGCLMLMDDNAFLVEWLAYHWFALPLRHLTVLVDPKSRTSPLGIFQRWENRISIEVVDWSYPDAYWTGIPEKDKGSKWDDPRQRKFVGTQLAFYGDCLRNYKRRNWNSYVVAIDTDEFLAVNREVRSRDSGEKLYRENSPGVDEAGSVLKLLKQEFSDNSRPDCINTVRQQLCSLPAPSTKYVDRLFESRDFLTLTWLSLPNPSNLGVVGPKALVNVGGISRDFLEGYDAQAAHPHALLGKRCVGGRRPGAFPRLFQIYHYHGTPEQNAREGDIRGELKYVLGTKAPPECKNPLPADDLVPWLEAFVAAVGKREAARLLDGAGRVDSWPAYTATG